jgi:predicted NBD/HSP70 family sugar kinase
MNDAFDTNEQMPGGAGDPVATRDGRHAEMVRLMAEMDRVAALSEGHFNALGMLVTDASLAADGRALEAAQDGLQWLYRRYADLDVLDRDDIEHRGRLLGHIDTTHWALRRLPSALQMRLDPQGYAARFLVAVARQPGLSNQQVAATLGVDETEVSRVGRRLLATGVVWRRKQWRHNVWDVTPRGRQYLAVSGLLPRAAGGTETVQTTMGGSLRLAYAVGVKVLPRLLVGVVVDGDANVLTEHERPLSGPLAADEAAVEIAGFARELLDTMPEADRRSGEVGLGIEIGGHVNSDDGSVVYAPNYAPHGDWTRFPLADRLTSELGLPTTVENDANALAEFEHAFGHHAGHACTATILLDEGIGCAIAFDGRVRQGAGGSAGELGHVLVEPGGRECRCGNRGCVETVAGTVAITDAISDRTARKITDLATAAEQADHGDPVVIDTVTAAGEALGRALAALLNLVNPGQLVLYGPAQLVEESTDRLAAAFMKGVRRTAEAGAFSNAARDCRIILKTYNHRMGAQAAAAVALLRSGR